MVKKRSIAPWAFAVIPYVGLAVVVLAQGGAAVKSTTEVSLLPWYQIVEPYLVMATGIVVSTVLGWIGLILKQKLGLDVDANLNASIQQAAVNAASHAIASVEGPIGDRRIDVHSALVKQGVDYMQTMIPGKLIQMGMTPDKVAAIVQAKLGALQAGQGVTIPMAPDAGTAPTAAAVGATK